MAEQETLMQKHLRTYVEDAMTTKFRLDRTIEGFKEMDKKTQEAIIDEGDLYTLLTGRMPQNIEQIQTVADRKQKNEQLRADYQRYIQEEQSNVEKLSSSIQHHLVELTDIEITEGGFIAHTIVHDHDIEFDETTKILSLDKKAHAEYAIATNLNQWRDSSQLKVIPRETN